MDKKKFNNIIRREEGPKLDFKQKLDLEVESNKKELAKDICAIANSKGGRGYLIVGIEDKTKRIVGLDESKIISEEQVQQIISSRCEPPIPIVLENIDIEEKKICIITIYDSDQKPYQLRENGAFYIRRGSTTDTMRKQELVSAFMDNLNLNIETCAVIKSKLEDLDNIEVDKYFLSKGIEISDENRITLMESAAIVIKEKESANYVVSMGGLLVFSDKNSVYIPHNMVRIVNKINRQYNEVIIIQGKLLDMINESEEVLNKILPEKYPSNAVFEGVKNAIIYRDYSIFYKEIEVIIDYNSISVISPGNLIKSNKVLQKYNNFIKKNMWIYEKLITIDGEGRFIKTGRGFGKMKKAFKNIGKVLFINSFEDNNFKVIFPGINILKTK